MKKVIFLLFMLGIFFSSSFNNRIRSITPTQDNQCLARLDSLSSVIQHIRFGVYSVNLKAFSIEKYRGLSDLDLAIQGVPLDEYGQQIHEFENLIEAFPKDTNCLAITSEMLIKNIGEPYSITPSRGDPNKLTYRYLFNIGMECPNCNEPINRMFDGCSHLTFYFEYKKLKKISYCLY
jgi:hypothetical protein